MNPRRDSHRSRAPQVTRLGLIGDVHTERVRLEGALAHLARLQPDRIACTGDLPDGPNDARAVAACCEALRQARALTVSGNHDRWLQDGEMRQLPGATDRDELDAATSSFLAGLPATLELDTPAGRVLLCHGLGADDMTGVQPYDHGPALDANEPLQRLLQQARYRYVISGHTHRPMVRAISGLTIINAGTLLREHAPCCSLVDFGARRIRFYDVAEDGSVTEGTDASL